LSLYCNRDYDNLDELIVEMIGLLEIIVDSIRRMLNLASCDRIVPIYHSAFYDSSCAYSVSAVFWVFSSSLIIGAFGVLMLLFRAACKPTLHESASMVLETDNNEGAMYDEQLKVPDESDVKDNVPVETEVEDTSKALEAVVSEEKEIPDKNGIDHNFYVDADVVSEVQEVPDRNGVDRNFYFDA
jgi:hypothetical protein